MRKLTVRAFVRKVLESARPIVGTAAASVMAGGAAVTANGAQLPVPCVAGSCGPTGPSVWVTSGAATATGTANSLTVNQTTPAAILNWASFNISADGKVVFNQPAASSIALNRIFQASPSQIFGMLQANGQVYLVNQNGILFGKTAQVNVGGLLASTLDMSDDTFKSGILTPGLAANGKPALEFGHANVQDAGGIDVLGPDGKPIPVQLTVQQGASITTNGAGQRLMLVGQNVDNAGTVKAPDGQVILAAGQKVFLQASTDVKLRGLIVEVDGGGAATNEISGDVSSDRGNVTLVGLAVNQLGRVSATTSTSANGSIRLLARDTTTYWAPNGGSATTIAGTHGGKLTLGPQSSTSVTPDLTDTSTVVDDQVQAQSTLEFTGQQVVFQGGSRVTAPDAQLTVTAATDLQPPVSISSTTPDPDAHIRIDTGASIDLSGSTATASVTRNLVSVQLRATELADSPLQRDGALRGQTVVVDARADGGNGTPLANVSGELGLIQRGILERTDQGGSVVFNSGGDVAVATGATVNVSGGAVNYTGGLMQTSQLVKADGSLVDIGSASPDLVYKGILNPTFTNASNTWGQSQILPTAGIAHSEQGYVQGASAGSIQFMGSSLILNGTFLGSVINGPYQRTSGIAQGGQFIVGDPTGVGGDNDLRAPAITFARNTPSIAFDDQGNLPSGLPLQLPVSSFASGGFTHIQIASNDGITIPAAASVSLPAGASLSLFGPRINDSANFLSPGGSLALTSTATVDVPLAVPGSGITLGDGVTFDVSGSWINDFTLPVGSTATGLALTNGGSIKLNQQLEGAALTMGSDVTLHANGGGLVSQSGVLTAGNGGSIALTSGPKGDFSVGSGFYVDGFAILGGKGGSFSLTAPRIAIGNGSAEWLPEQIVHNDPAAGGTGTAGSNTGTGSGANPDSGSAAPPADVLQVGSGLFRNFGFSSISLAANGPRPGADPDESAVLTVLANTSIDARTSSVLLSNDALLRPTGQSVMSFSKPQLFPDYLRQASKVTLSATPATDTLASDYGDLVFASGAQLIADPGSTVNLSSLGSLLFDGTIHAADGAVSMTLGIPSSTITDAGYVPGRVLELGKDSLIDVAGTVIYKPSDVGLLQGTLFSGGSVTLNALRGAVQTDLGSTIDFSGTAASLDLPGSDARTGYQRTLIGTSAGSLSVEAATSLSLLGNLRAQPGQGTTGNAAGGTLTVALTASGAAIPNSSPGFPNTPRNLEILADDGGKAQDDYGVGALGLNRLAGSGIDALKLVSDDQIMFASDVQLSMGRSFIAQSPALGVGTDVHASVTAPYMAIGTGVNGVVPGATDVAAPGSGTLALQGDSFDVIGSVAFQGAGHTTLTSTGEIQLRGDEHDDTNTGVMSAAGYLTLSAARIVPGTYAHYTINDAGGLPDTDIVRFQQNGTLAGVPLSVAGSLTVNATDIVQAGTIIAPFGQIALNATDTVNLAPGSLTSVSGAGATLPYGRVDNGNSWVYEVQPLHPLDVGGVPQRQVSLTAPTVAQASGATIDISGGGDLQAYQWTPGTGGSKDLLAGGAISGLYSVLPSLGNQSAPYDPLLWSQAGLQPNQSIYLSGGGGLAAGTYTLLPARYALLPGAFLVQSVSGFQDLQPATHSTVSNGVPVVAGYLTYGNTGIGDTRYSGYLVRPGTYGQQLADYTNNLASSFFDPSKSTSDAPTGSGARPADAGTLMVAVQDAFYALGSLRAKGDKDGDNGTVEISADSIQIDPSVQQSATSSGTVHLAASTLNSWGAGRLLIGGVYTSPGNLRVDADSVRVASGATVTADEVVLAANQNLTLDAGAAVTTTAYSTKSSVSADRLAKPTNLTLTADGAAQAAVLGVSDLAYLVTDRSNAQANGAGGSGAGGGGGTGSGAGQLVVSAGALLGSSGSLMVDSAGGAQIADGSLAAAGARVSLGADHIALGTDVLASNTLAVDGSLLSALNSAKSVRLATGTSLDVTQSVSLTGSSLEQIDLFASTINNLTDGATATFAAKQITLGSSSASLPPPAVSTTTGSLQLHAQEIDVGPGSVVMSGFDHVAMQATSGVVGQGTGSLQVSNDLTISTPVLTAISGAQTVIAANNGTLALTGLGAGTAATAAPPLQTGGSLSFSADMLDDSTGISLPTGKVAFAAVDALNFGSGASVSVTGVMPANAAHGSGGGTIDVLSAGAQLPDGTVSGGTLTIANGATFDVSAATGADAGSINLFANGVADIAGGRYVGSADVGFQGGSFAVQAHSLTDFSGLNRQLEQGAFTTQRDFRVATGSLALGAGDTLTARTVKLTADGGAIDIAGTIDASALGARGLVEISARDDLTVEGTIRANGLDANTKGGSIRLGTVNGTVTLASNATIAAQGADSSGTLQIRAPAVNSGATSDIQIGGLPADLSHVNSVLISPELSFAQVPYATLGADDFAQIASQVGNYIQSANPNIARLGIGAPGHTNVTVSPYVDITSDGDLTVGDSVDFNTTAWRFNGQPATIALRASGNLEISGTLSDGFALVNPTPRTASSAYLNPIAGPSSAFTLVAGADLTSASKTSVRDPSAGNLTVDPGISVRTGTGDITLASAGDVNFGLGASVFTGGASAAPSTTTATRRDGAALTLARSYARGGGSVFVSAGGSVGGDPTDVVAVGDWQRGVKDGQTQTLGAWGIDFSRFQWDLGALGGGDVNVVAKGNVSNISAAVGDSILLQNGAPVTFGGGNLTVRAGGDIGSNVYYVAQGLGRVTAGGALTSTRTGGDPANPLPLYTMLLAANGSYSMSAWGDISLTGELNPTALYPLSSSDSTFVPSASSPENEVHFFSYGPDSALRLASAGGRVMLDDSQAGGLVGASANPDFSASGAAAHVLPGTLDIAAYGGDINLDSTATFLFPSAHGQLSLYAGRDINALGLVLMSDVSSTFMSTSAGLNPNAVPTDAFAQTSYSQAVLHVNDALPNLITAGRDINNFSAGLPKATELTAGRDIVDLNLAVQDVNANDVTRISAGRDFTYTPDATSPSLSIAGPGQYQLVAGRNVNFGFSAGITSNGNLANPLLPNGGASVSVVAGLSNPVGVAALTPGPNGDFLTNIVSPSSDYQKQLVSYVETATGLSDLTYDQAVQKFRGLDPGKQLPFIEGVFFSELVLSGKEANDPNLFVGFQRGYAAIDALFPGSRPAAGATNPYQGDITLPFSRIYTAGGGSISLLAPGGQVNLGLANPPAATTVAGGLHRAASDLGIVAVRSGDVRIFSQGDVLVNESRIFTLGGGNIDIWSDLGNIDAGRGAKTAISAPPPSLTVNTDGSVSLDFQGAVAGSGIRTILTGGVTDGGDVNLIAPVGFVNAGDAGIGAARNLNVAAQRVLGLDNIQVGGTSTGVPPVLSGLGASLSAASAASSSTTAASGNSIADSAENSNSKAPLASAAMNWLDVFVEGFGQEVCKSSDLDCLKRQPK